MKRTNLSEQKPLFLALFEPKGYLFKKTEFDDKLTERFSVLNDQIILIDWKDFYVEIEYLNKTNLKKLDNGVFDYKTKKIIIEEDIIKGLFGIKENVDEFLVMIKFNDQYGLLKPNACSLTKYKDNLYYYIKVTHRCKIMI